MKIVTWNVNGIRRAVDAGAGTGCERDRPDVICLQEIKATPDQIPTVLCEMEGYWCYWHGSKGYSGVALHVSRDLMPERPQFNHPSFDYENRIVTVELPGFTLASVYVPNGGKDFPAKMQFLAALEQFVAERQTAPAATVICGDLNIARTDMDVHPKERKPQAIGQLPEEREQLERIIGHGLVDVGRALDPRQRPDCSPGGRPGATSASATSAGASTTCWRARASYDRASRCDVPREFGTSDHAPVVS